MGRHRSGRGCCVHSARRCPAPSCPAIFDNNLSDWFGTVRARAGVAFDRVLVYATGGLAYTDDNTGWVVGGGVEWALPVNWFGSSAVTFGLEGLWLSFDEDDDNNFNGSVGTFTPVGGPTVALDRADRTQTTRTNSSSPAPS